MLKELKLPLGKLKCAPPREILKMFGGTMDITEFRQNASLNYKVRQNMELDEGYRYSPY
jgi:hypothetical protein